MKVLVTGGAGYIGSVTAELLLNEGHDVTVFDNLDCGHRSAVDSRADFIEGDLTNRKAVSLAIGKVKPEAVIHFAAFALVPESMKKPEIYFRNNVVGGINLADAMLENNVKKIVFSSTCATYGVPDSIPITEEQNQKPTNPYGESKLMYETVLTWYHKIHGLNPVFLRYFNACGATEKYGEDHDPETHIIPIVLQVAQGKRDKVMICGEDYDTPDGSCIRDYIHIVDLAQAHIQAISLDVWGPFNLGTGTGHSVKEIIATAREVTGHPIPAEKASRRLGDPAELVAGAQKARDILKWEPRFGDLKTIISSAWKWHQSHPNGYADK